MYSKANILLIEDDRRNVSSISNLLGKHGYQVTSAHTGREGLCLAASLCPHMILLNSGLPDIDDCQVLRQLRSWSSIPVIVISTQNEEQSKVVALDMGADDYITEPFGTEELLARIRTSLRHGRIRTPDRIYRALDLEINFDKRSVLLAGKGVHLTQTEYQLLTLLAENSGSVLTYGFLLNALWGPYMNGSNRILRVNMSNIRRKIEKNPSKPQYLFTEMGIGYRMLKGENLPIP